MPWIRSLPSHRPSTPPPPIFEDITVNYLMNSDCLSWNHSVVNTIFNQQDATVVITTPLISRPLVDTRIWKTTSNGEYWVKSAYRLCADLLLRHASVHQNFPWSSIWNLQIPPRVRTFMWRLAHQCLPTRNNLTTRGIPFDDSCVVCELLVESHMHLFFVCDKAKECWENIGMGNLIRKLLSRANNFSTLLFDFLSTITVQQQQIVAMVLWSLWKSRNTKLWEFTDNPTVVIISRAKDTLYEWSCMQRAKFQTPNRNQLTTWSKPPLGVTKCNVDAAIFHNNAITGYGICFRNSEGHFIMGKSDFSTSNMSVLEAEAVALLEAIKLAANNGYLFVQFETDNKIPAAAVNSSCAHIHINEFGDTVSQCRDLLILYTDFRVSFIRRQANRVAHSIARASLSHTSPHLFYAVPDSLYPLLMNKIH